MDKDLLESKEIRKKERDTFYPVPFLKKKLTEKQKKITAEM